MKTILLVEPDKEKSDFITQTLLAEGYSIIVTRNCFEVFRVVDAVKPDLFLIDYNLPNLNGISLYERLHAREQLNNVPVIVLNSYQADGIEQIKEVIDRDAFVKMVEEFISVPVA